MGQARTRAAVRDVAKAAVRDAVRDVEKDVALRGAWAGPAALHLSHHALAPVAELPVLEIVSAIHILADLTLGLGKVAHDYLRQPSRQAPRTNEMALVN